MPNDPDILLHFPAGDAYMLFQAAKRILARLLVTPPEAADHGVQRVTIRSECGNGPLLRFTFTGREKDSDNPPPTDLAESIMPCVARAFKSVGVHPFYGLWDVKGGMLFQRAERKELVRTLEDELVLNRRGPNIFGLASTARGNALHILSLYGNDLGPSIRRLLHNKNIVSDAAYTETEQRMIKRQIRFLETRHGLE